LNGLAIGLVKSFPYGALLGPAYAPIHNLLQRRCGG
jgi:hypothetical protein